MTGTDHNDEHEITENISQSSNRSEYYVSDIWAPSLPTGKGIPKLEDLTANLKTQVGFCSTRAELSEDLMTLTQTGLFESVEAEIHPTVKKDRSDSVRVVFKFTSRNYPPLESFRIAGASKIPQQLNDVVMAEYKNRGKRDVDISTIAMIKNIVEGFYEEHGFAYCYISHFDGMEGGHVVANVAESKVRSVKLVPLDEVDNPTEKTEHNLQMITMDVRNTIKEAALFSVNDTRKALREVFGTRMFENVQVIQRPDGDPSSSPVIDVEFLVHERPSKTVEIETDWQLQLNKTPSFVRVNPLPSGSIVFEHRNVRGNGTQISASLSAQNLVLPEDDIAVKFEMKKTFLRGINNTTRINLNVALFNTRKLSTAFSPIIEEKQNKKLHVKALWITRLGIKAGITEKYSRNSSGSISLIAESVTSHDDSGLVEGNIQGDIFEGEASKGPRTTLSDSGSDKLLFLRGNVIRDTSFRKGSSIIGQRQIFTFSHGIAPLFYQHLASITHLYELEHLPVKRNAPATLVLHCKLQNCIGDFPPYDCAVLGGPFSCRGYSTGEIGSALNFLEAGFEIRYPLTIAEGQIYSYAERSESLDGQSYFTSNLHDFHRLIANGSSWGYGIKFGVTRIEYARDCNVGCGTWFVRFGERF
eukprot:gnl/MRDRNA2_/MRDRNA2_86543_c0_seq4.p1 gnl/MRDRNA2_/MRDRNA2_86543_c0~~gnl/MRDRNA2_/MRDRNA2_86543_c0_seq4.p1  ORF type:complete len:752 (+),score=17.14 gnl/MRDRNA2_/MRDRNA2_86543_c0_seq4:332-2257(+)